MILTMPDERRTIEALSRGPKGRIATQARSEQVGGTPHHGSPTCVDTQVKALIGGFVHWSGPSSAGEIEPDEARSLWQRPGRPAPATLSPMPTRSARSSLRVQEVH